MRIKIKYSILCLGFLIMHSVVTPGVYELCLLMRSSLALSSCFCVVLTCLAAVCFLDFISNDSTCLSSRQDRISLSKLLKSKNLL